MIILYRGDMMDNENAINNDIKYDFKSTVVLDEKDFLEIGRTNYFVFSLISFPSCNKTLSCKRSPTLEEAVTVLT